MDKILLASITLLVAFATSVFIFYFPLTSGVINFGFGVLLAFSIIRWAD